MQLRFGGVVLAIVVAQSGSTQQPAPATSGADWPMSVSYTHLTLPTIYSV